MSAPEFATFWHGPLDPTTAACLASFPAKGARLRLYAYDRPPNLPADVEFEDARKLCPDASYVGRFRVGGKPSLAVFSDYFRCKMLRRGGGVWVDADMICLTKVSFEGEPIVFGRQPPVGGEALINNAVLKLPKDDTTLLELEAAAEAALDRDLSWGAIGPFLLSPTAERNGIAIIARPPECFYPISADDFWMALLPVHCAETKKMTSGAAFMHLWAELLRRCGYDSSAAPPEGSWLHTKFDELGALGSFRGENTAAQVAKFCAPWMEMRGRA